MGLRHLLRVPGHGLLWQGALVTLEIDEKEDRGVSAYSAERSHADAQACDRTWFGEGKPCGS